MDKRKVALVELLIGAACEEVGKNGSIAHICGQVIPLNENRLTIAQGFGYAISGRRRTITELVNHIMC